MTTLPDVLGLELEKASGLLAELGFAVRAVACDSRPPDGADARRVLRVKTSGDVVELVYGEFKTGV